MKANELPLVYNASTLLEHNLAHRADKIAIYTESAELTFQAVNDEANQIGNALRQAGIRFGDCVGILAPDSAEWVTSFFGIIKLGAIAVCMNTLLQTHEVEYILQDSHLRLLIVHQSLLHLVAPVLDKYKSVETVIVIDAQNGDTAPGVSSFREWIAEQPTTLETVQTHRDDFCSLHYSSGTTGQPKGMYHAHKDLPLVAQNSGVDLFGLTENDRTFSVPKLFFTYGLGGNLAMPFYVGASIVLYAGSPRMATSIFEMIDRFQPTVLYSVPTVYINQLMFMKTMAERSDLSSLRLCITAGEAMPAPVWEEWRAATGLEILDTVGCTETIGKFLANRPHDLRPGSSGKPAPGCTVKLIDDEGNEVADGEIGNLLVKGETTVLFYLHQYARSHHAFRGDWFFTGDKYYRDADGFYWHVGRSDDTFKVGGLWVSPVEVESTLTSHPAVLFCAVIGQEDAQHRVKPKAFIHLAEGYAPTTELISDLLAHCGKSLDTYKRPRWIEFVDELPKTATGKIQRYKLRV